MALNYAYTILGTAIFSTSMVLDEEILVLYSFILFVAMTYHYLNCFVDDFICQETLKMRKDFDTFFEIQKKLLKTLIHFHSLQILVVSEMKELLNFLENETFDFIRAKKVSLDSAIVLEIEQKLILLSSKELIISQGIQNKASIFLGDQVLAIFKGNNEEKIRLKEVVLEENMEKLESLSF